MVCDCLRNWHLWRLLPLALLYTVWQTLLSSHEQQQRTTKIATSNMFLFSLCPLEGELKRNATLCICLCAVPMCGACVASGLRWMWQHGIFVLRWGMPLTLLSLIKTQAQQQSEHKHTPWSLVYMGIHAWGLNTTKQCWIVSEPPNKQICATLAKQIATKFSLVWLTCCLAMELINIASVKSRSITNDGGWMQPKAKDCRVTIKLNIEWDMCVCACMGECVRMDASTRSLCVSQCFKKVKQYINKLPHNCAPVDWIINHCPV